MTTTTTVRAEPGPGGEPPAWRKLLGNRLVQVFLALIVLTILARIGAAVTSNDNGGGTDTGAATSTDQPSAGATTAPLAPPLTQQIIPPLPGATATSGVVPVGYPQTEAGSVAAATNYLTVLLGSPSMLTAATRDPIIAAAVAPESQEQVRAELGGLNDEVSAMYDVIEGGTTRTGGTVVMMLTPKSYHLDSYSPDRAVVSIWHDVVTGVSGAQSTYPPSASYGTATVTLGWINGDWKWLSVDGYDGPTPTGASDTGGADPAALDTVTTQWTRYTYGAGGTP